MKKQMKPWAWKRIPFKYSGLLLSFSFLTSFPILAKEDLPSRDIYVVYDDSGSMYVDNDGNSVDTWSKAKYSMEVFASMLGDKDSMAIYYMSDYSPDGKKDGPKIEIDGSNSTKSNVQKIHDQRTSSGYTPFETVEAAYADLEKSQADEKWLVILTDGDFQKNDVALEDKNQVTQFMDTFFENKDPEVNVAFLAIGENVIPLTENQEEKIFFEKASNSTQILEKVTEISNRVFNMNRLNLANSNGQFEIDVPMEQITVFVQGPQAKIQGLTNAKGQTVGTIGEIVSVKATESSDNDLHLENVPDHQLNGELATFNGDFLAGTYQIQAQNAEKIEVYYKPNLEVVAYLTDATGNRLTNLADLPSGEYSIHFELVSGIDQSALPQRNLINQSQDGIQYQARIKNNQKTLESLYQDGDTIYVDQGDLDIDVTATYLKYNTVSTHLNYNIWSQKSVSFKPVENENGLWTLNQSLTPTTPLQVEMEVENQALSVQEWQQVEVPNIQVVSNELLETPTVLKEQKPGLFSIVPNETQRDFEQEPYTQARFLLSFDEEIDQISWQGSQEIEVKIEDKRSWWIKHGKMLRQNWWIALPGLGILIWLFGLLPFAKKRLPKLEPSPKIECRPKSGGPAKKEAGKVTKDTKSVWIPFVPEKAKIQVIPYGAKGAYVPDLEVEAIGNGEMKLTNVADFEKVKLKIDGKAVDKMIEKARKGGNEEELLIPLHDSSRIESEGRNELFKCKLNESYE